MPEAIDQKEAIIYWNQDKDHHVTDFIVVPQSRDKHGKYDAYKLSGGACLAGFDEYSALDILVNYYIGLDFADEKFRAYALQELYKIKEFRKALRGYAKYRIQIQYLEVPYLLEEI